MNENENSNNETQQEPSQINETSIPSDLELKECQTQRDEWKDRCLRTVADFENFKRRVEKEKMMWIASAQSSIIQDLLSIVDDFDRAFAQEQNTANTQGFALIYKAFAKLLEKYGVQEIKDLTHFDPTYHEAIMQVESSDHKPGDIVQVLQKGYTFKGEVLRPAKVSVAK